MKEWFIRNILRRKVRGFEVVAPWARVYPNKVVTLPTRSTDHSAGYDFYALHDGLIRPGEKVEFYTDVKIYMQPDEVCRLYPRSNHGLTYDLMLSNTTGVIDADYYENPKNDGRVSIMIRNLGNEPFFVTEGDKLAQGVFDKFLKTDNDKKQPKRKRVGGVGSTGR